MILWAAPYLCTEVPSASPAAEVTQPQSTPARRPVAPPPRQAEQGAHVVAFDTLNPGPLPADAFEAAGGRILDCNGTPVVADAAPAMVVPAGHRHILLVEGGRDTSLTLGFDPPLKRFSLTRVGLINGASIPTWALNAFDRGGKELATAGEQHGSYQQPRQVSVSGAGIARVRLSTDNRFGEGTWATYNSLPVAEIEVERDRGEAPPNDVLPSASPVAPYRPLSAKPAAALPSSIAVEHFKKGMVLLRKGKRDEAIEEWQSAVSLDPLYVEAQRQYSKAMLEAGRRSEVAEQYRQMLDAHPDSPVFTYLLARTLTDPAERFRSYMRAHRLDSSFVWAYVGISASLSERGMNSDALRWLRDGLRIAPTHPALTYNLAVVSNALKDSRSAEQAYLTLLNDEEFGYDASFDLARLYDTQKKYTQAEQYYQRAAKISEARAEPHFYLGYIYSNVEQRYDIAADEYRKCISLDRKLVEPYFNLAGYYREHKKDVKKAEQYYKLALQVDPQYEPALASLADLYLDTRRNEEAVRCFDELLRLAPADGPAHNNRGIALMQQGKEYESIEEFTTAYSLQPGRPAACVFNMGEAYRRAGEYDKAVKLFDFVRGTDTNNPDKSSMDEWLPYMRGVLQRLRVTIHDVYADPPVVRPGGAISLIMKYSVSGASDSELLLTEERTVRSQEILLGEGEPVVGRPMLDYTKVHDGQYSSALQIVVPTGATPGTYTYAAWVGVCGVEAQRRATFQVVR